MSVFHVFFNYTNGIVLRKTSHIQRNIVTNKYLKKKTLKIELSASLNS